MQIRAKGFDNHARICKGKPSLSSTFAAICNGSPTLGILNINIMYDGDGVTVVYMQMQMVLKCLQLMHDQALITETLSQSWREIQLVGVALV